MKNKSQILGLTLHEAKKEYPEHTIRVIKKDGKHKCASCDFQIKRIDVSINNGKIDEVVYVG